MVCKILKSIYIRYADSLVSAKKASIRRGLVSGIGMGLMWLVVYASYSLAFWYGTKLILDSRGQEDPSYGPKDLVIVSIFFVCF